MRTEEQLKWERRSRRFWLVLALFYTIPAIISLFPLQHLGWLDVPRSWQGRTALWGAATFFWLLYVTRPRIRGQASLAAILFTISPILILHYLSRSGVHFSFGAWQRSLSFTISLAREDEPPLSQPRFL